MKDLQKNSNYLPKVDDSLNQSFANQAKKNSSSFENVKSKRETKKRSLFMYEKTLISSLFKRYNFKIT
jgi:hypothetical protein